MPTVLLVDDDSMTRGLLSRVLGREGFVALEAKDGAEALDLLERLLPSVIVLDLEMPKLDGLEVLERLKEHPRLRALPVIVLSGLTDARTLERVQELGARHYIEKAGFSVHEMLQHLRRLTAPTPVH